MSILTCKHSPHLPDQETVDTPHGSYTVYRTGTSRWSYFRSAPSFLNTFLSEHHIDLIHCHTYAAALVGSLARNRFHIPTLVTIHEIFDDLWYRLKPRWNARIYRFIEKYVTTRSYDHIHVPSHYTKHMLVNRHQRNTQKITVIGHDIDPSRDPYAINSNDIHDRQTKLGPDRYKVLYYGHAGASKGVHTLLRSLQTILPHHENMLFVANITASRNRDTLIQEIHDTLPEGSYHIETGMDRDKLQALVMTADIVVVPSISEGFGFVGAEVSALEKTAIVAHSGSLPEVVSGDIHFFEPENSDQLSETILDIYNNQTTNTAISTYNVSGNARRVVDLYTKIIEHTI